MDEDTLRIFLSLTSTLHFGRASKQVHKSPSAVSRTLTRLEEQLGQTLFERDNRRVKLTPQGEVFQRYASESLARLDELRQALKLGNESLRGSIAVFASVTACQSFLPPLAQSLSRGVPGRAAQARDRLRRRRAVAAVERRGRRDGGGLARRACRATWCRAWSR